MKRLVSLGLAFLLIVTALSGCGGKTPTTTTNSQDSPSQEATAAPAAEQKAITTVLNGASKTSDPFNHSALNDRAWQGNVFEPIFSYNAMTQEYEPRVGKTYSISDDGLEYTIEIFSGIKFHNGDACKAEDVKWSIEYGKACSYNQSYSGCIDHVEVLNDTTIKIVLQYPNAAFMNNLDRIFVISPREVQEQGDEFGTKENLAGTGPFYIESYEGDVEIKLVRFDDYYRDDIKVQIPAVTFRIVTDATARSIALESGDIQFAEVAASQFKKFTENSAFTTNIKTTPQLISIMINNKHDEMVGNKKVRQALAYATDYASVNMVATEGYGSVDGKIFYAPVTIGATEDYGITYSYDKEKAKALLTEAGYPNGLDLGTITCISGGTHQKIAQVLKANWEEVGITVSINALEQNTCISEMRLGNYGVGIMSIYHLVDWDYYSNQVGSENESTKFLKTSDAPDYDSKRIDELLLAGRKEMDLEKRKLIYQELDDILMEAAIDLPLYHSALCYAWEKDLVINTNKTYTYQYYYFWDAYWK